MFLKLTRRVRALFKRSELDGELDEELRFHLEREAEENVRRGMSPEEARRAALVSFGGVERVKEECREARGVRAIQDLRQDMRYGVRTLRKQPGFTLVAVLMLALGISACTAIFSIVDAVLLRPLPYPNADRLVSLREVDAKGRQISFAEPNFLDVRARSHTLASAAEYVAGLVPVTGGSEPVRTSVAYVSGDFFKTLGVQPAIGRSFLPEEAAVGGRPVVVVSQGFWQKLLGSRGDLSAATLRVGDTTYAVVGVMPQGFNFPKDAEAWVPIELLTSGPSRTSHGKRVIARLRDGVTLEQARADLGVIGKQLRQENGANVDLVDVAALPLKEALVGDVSGSLLAILAAVGFLLLVACTNVANLLLARATARQRELAVRTALGATRWRLARQFIAENLMLTLLAGGAGVLLSFWGVDALVGLNRGNLPRADEIGVNARALVFTFALSSLVAVALGFVPLLRFGGRDLQDGLKESARGASAGAARRRLRAALVVTQVALTMVLLTGAGLLVKSFLKVLEVDPGFRTESAVAMEISPPNDERPAGYASDEGGKRRRAVFYQQALERVAALPGVTAVGGVNGLPMTDGGTNGQFLIDNDPARKGYGEFRVASPGYFDTMGIRLLRGRLFDSGDGPGTQQVALVSDSLARQYWPDEDPLDESIQYGSMDGDKHLLRVIGVVGDVREFGLEANPRPTVYVDYLQRPGQAWNFTIVARTRGDATALIPAMRGAMQSLDRNVPTNFRTLGQIFSSSLDNRRFSLVIFGTFAAAALLLAALGIYGVTSYDMMQRTQEIGIRVALGARVADVLRLVIGQGMKSVLLGAAIGLGGALALTRLIAHLLFGVSATDPLTFTVVTALLALVGLLACYLPARRATKVDPMIALRYE
ncbi:MAG: ABC transporter permease [Acidobacteriota bacterium]|nr:ABC transporter permease [Acidobacteriota bacterium]